MGNKFTCLFLVVFGSFAGYSQSNYRTSASGDWSNPGIWEIQSGITWSPAGAAPTFADGTITVSIGDDVIISSNLTIDQTTVRGILTVNDGIILTINNGSGSDFFVPGRLNLLGESYLDGAGNIVINAGGVLAVGSTNATGAIINGAGGGNIRIPLRTYAMTSKIIYNGTTGAQVIGNGHPVTTGVLAELDNAAGFSVNNTTSTTVTFGGDLTIVHGDLNAINNNIRAVGNIFIQSGNMAITATSVSRTATIAGNLNLNGGTFSTTSGSALSTVTINGNLNLTPGDLTINGSGSANATVNITGDITGTGKIHGSGTNANLVINGSGALSYPGFPLATASTFEQITLNRAGETLTFPASPFTITLKALRVAAGNVITNIDLTLTGDLNLAAGTSFDFSGHDLTLQGRFNGSLTGGFLKANGSSDLSITGTGTLGTLAFLPGFNTIGSFTMNRATGGTIVTLNSVLTVNTAINLTDGAFANTSGLDVASGLVLTRNSNATMTGAAPTGGPYSIIYSGSGFITTGPEAGGLISTITSNSSGTVSLGMSGIVATGALTVNSGIFTAGSTTISAGSVVIAATTTFNSPSSTLTITGNFTNNGTFNKNNGTIIFNGNSSILGSVVPAFHNITITGILNGGIGLTLQGDFTNNGTFNGGTSVVQFTGSGAQTISGSSASSFAAMTINKSSTSTVTISSPVSAATGVTMILGKIDNTLGLLTLGNGSVFTRASGTTLIGAAPLGGPYDLVYTGTLLTTGPEAQGAINNVTNNSTSTVTLNVPMTIPGTLTLNSGIFSNVGGFVTMGNGATIARNGTGTFSGVIPAGGPYNLVYSGTTYSTGIEARGSLNNVTSNMSGTLTIANALVIPGLLTISSGIVSNNALVLTVANILNNAELVSPTTNMNVSADFTNNATFTHHNGTVTFTGTSNLLGTSPIVFNKVSVTGSLASAVDLEIDGSLTNSGSINFTAGTTSFGGTTVITNSGAALNFHSINVLNGHSLTAPSNNMTIGGDLTIDGTFNPNAGTIIFNGISTLFGSGTKVFNDVSVTGSLAGAVDFEVDSHLVNSGSVNLTGGTLTIGGNVVITNSGPTLDLFAVNIPLGRSLTAPATTMGVGGDFTIDGTFTHNGGTVDFVGNSNLLGSGTKLFNNISVSGTLGGTANWQIDGDVTVSGTISFAGGTVTFGGTTSISGAGTISFNNLTIGAGSTLNSSTGVVGLAGDFVDNGGTFNANSGTITFLGTNAATKSIQSGGLLTFYNLTVNNNAAANPDVSAETTVDLINVLTVGTDAVFDPDGVGNSQIFTLRSTSDQPVADASIGALTGSASVVGNVTVQRYMSAKGTINEYISTPLSNAPVSQLQDDFDITGHFTGSNFPCTGCENDNASLRWYDETVKGILSNGYKQYPIAANTEFLQPGRGYLGYQFVNKQTTWDVRGTINSGTISLPVSKTNSTPPNANNDGWNLVGNPYPSAVIWDNGPGWSRANIAPIIYVHDGQNNVDHTFNYTDLSGDLPGGAIQMGQAFWVYANTAAVSLSINEQAKVSGHNGGNFYRVIPSQQLMITLKKGKYSDNAFFKINSNATAEFDELYDGYKLENEILNISLTDQRSNNLVMHTLQTLQADEKISVAINVAEAGDYTIQFTPKENFSYTGALYLIDRDESESVRVTAETSYNFKVAKSGRYDTRFYLSLNPVVEQRTIEESFTVYPNPVVEDLTVQTGVKEPVAIVIYNSLGEVVQTATILDTGIFHMKDWAKGMYIVKGRYDKGTTAKRIVKQ